MDHLRYYNLIIEKVKIENRKKYVKSDRRYVYYEKHHILPKCLGGTNDKENLVLLTAREHYICHKLLTYIYKGNRKIANAFCRMTWDKNGNRNISSKDYAYARELKSSIPMSEETKKKMRKPKAPFTDQHKRNIRLAAIGRKRSEESKQKQRNTLKGKPKPYLKGKIPWNKGLTKETDERIKDMSIKSGLSSTGISRNKGHIMSDEQKKKLRILNTGKKQSKETIEKRKKTMGDPWNKGLTKETDLRLKEAGKNISLTKIKNGYNARNKGS